MLGQFYTAKSTTYRLIWIFTREVTNFSPQPRAHQQRRICELCVACPAGRQILERAAAGKDCTAQFEKFHPWVNHAMLLKDLYLGPVLER